MSRVLILCRLLFALVVALPGIVGAQEAKYPIPDKVERATTEAEDGTLLWAEYKAPKCGSCNGVGKSKCATCARFAEDWPHCPECKRKDAERLATCRVCAGTGELADPLEKVACPGCLGAAFLVCTVCSGSGKLKVGEAKNFSDCPSCRGDGGFPCTVCKGDRVVTTVPLKPSLKDANSATLRKAIESAEELLKQLEAFQPAGGDTARKELKALTKLLDDGKALHPAFKALPKLGKDYLGKVFAGAQFQGHEQHEAEAMNRIKVQVDYFLKHQRRMMQLALERAEANEVPKD